PLFYPNSDHRATDPPARSELRSEKSRWRHRQDFSCTSTLLPVFRDRPQSTCSALEREPNYRPWKDKISRRSASALGSGATTSTAQPFCSIAAEVVFPIAAFLTTFQSTPRDCLIDSTPEGLKNTTQSGISGKERSSGAFK